MEECSTDMAILHSFEFEWTIKRFLLYVKNVEQNMSTIILESSHFPKHGALVNRCGLSMKICGRSYDPKTTKYGSQYVLFLEVLKDTVPRRMITCFLVMKNRERLQICCKVFGPEVKKSQELHRNDLIKLVATAGINDLNDQLTIICRVETFGLPITSSENSLIPKVNEKDLSCYFEELFESGKFSDITFIFKDKKLEAHKVILATRSPVFAAMFKHPMKERSQNEVKIDDIDHDVFKIMLQYIYTNKIPNLGNEASNLLYAADKYELQGLKNKCIVSIWKEITVANAAEALVFADRHNLQPLMERIKDFIYNHIRDVAKTTGFKNMEKNHAELFNMIYRESFAKMHSQ